MEITNKKPAVSIRSILKLLAAICFVMTFCPAFLVSCSGTMSVNVMTAVEGVTVYGETMIEPHPWMLVCFVLPLLIIGVLFVRSLGERESAALVFISSAADIGIWIAFRAAVKRIAEANYCTFETTGWFAVNMVSLSLILLLSLFVFVGIRYMDADLLQAKKERDADVPPQPASDSLYVQNNYSA